MQTFVKWIVFGLFVLCLSNFVMLFMAGSYFSAALNFGLAVLNWYNFQVLSRC